MNLREPRKKPRVRIQLRAPLPVTIGTNDEWVVYTAHLTEFGSCIVNPEEMMAVHSMGFFGKGSLSRGYPSFGKSRYGVPPTVRNRQWSQRQEWFQDVKKLYEESQIAQNDNTETEKGTENKDCGTRKESNCYQILTKGQEVHSELSKPQSSETNKSNDIVEIMSPSQEPEIIDIDTTKNVLVDEITLDSAEEDDTCIVLNADTNIQPQEDKESSTIDEMEICCETDNDNNKYIFADVNDTHIQGKLLILPDSDSDTDNYLKNVKPRIENEGFPVREVLHLTAEETFFLLFGLGCLQVINFDGSFLDVNSAWLHFCKQKHFIQKYVVYHYFRSKGWVVKPGLKYGGDFLLYKKGPPFYHASYIVIVDVVDTDSLIRDSIKSTRQTTWNNLFGLERLSETAAKEILFAQVLWPSSVPRDSTSLTPEVLSEFSVKELLWRRWVPKQTRDDVVNVEEEDEDSS